MEKKDKTRGLKHFKDKRKYKDNTTKNPKYVPPKQLPKLESNWDRYEDVEAEDGLINCSPSTDFSILANAPVTKGNHFQFKNDKIVVEETEQDLFNFDLGTLNDSILAIPFYSRMQIDESYFTQAQLNSMKKEAEENHEKYIRKWKSNCEKQSEVQAISNKVHEVQLVDRVQLNKDDILEKQNSDVNVKPIANVTTINEVISSSGKDANKGTPETNLNENLCDEDMDKWLDELLAD